MWRFVLLSLVFMAFAFYQLSGGAEYEPAENSIQANGGMATLFVAERSDRQPRTTGTTGTTERTVAEVEASLASLEEPKEDEEEVELTLAPTRTDASSLIRFEATRPKAELLKLELPENFAEDRAEEDEQAIEAAIAAAMGEVAADPDKLRWVSETVVELRAGPGLNFDKVTELIKGTEVAILEDPGHGWLNVQVTNGFESGWVAEWLLKEPE